jgi:hypothetical protein
MKSQTLPSSSTASYCQARANLDFSSLEAILEHTSNQRLAKPDLDLMHGHLVVVVDGTGVSMPDTEKNQLVWPQQRHQKLGCSFPQAAICACFCLQTGLLLSYQVGKKIMVCRCCASNELPLNQAIYSWEIKDFVVTLTFLA